MRQWLRLENDIDIQIVSNYKGPILASYSGSNRINFIWIIKLRLETKEIETKPYMSSHDAKNELIELINFTMDAATCNGYWRKIPDLVLEHDNHYLKYIGKATILFTKLTLPAAQMINFGWEDNIDIKTYT